MTPGRAGPALQIMLVLASVAFIASPPPAGAMLIVPLVPTETGRTVRWALAVGARLAAPGPYAGSIVVDASRATLFPAALAHGAILITAHFTKCGNLKDGLT